MSIVTEQIQDVELNELREITIEGNSGDILPTPTL